jgi:hypothetical protein
MASRRQSFMTLTSAVALALTGGVGAVASSQPEPPDPAVIAEARELVSAYAWAAAAVPDTHGVAVLYATTPFRVDLPNGEIIGDAPAVAAMETAAAVVAEELALLPPGFARAAGLGRVVLCGELTEARRPIPSLPNWRGTLLLDAGGSPEFLRRLLHHELWHFADLADDGDVVADGAWQALLPEGFAYAGGGRFMREPAAARPEAAPAGFVTPYATAALEEDKAETFAFMVTEPVTTRERALADPVLAAKVARIRELAATLDAGMDDRFWRQLEAWRGR